MISFTVSDYSDIISLQRPLITRPSMEISHRAKQFAPFAALQGFEQNIRQKEIIYEERRILSDDQKEEINRFLHTISIGMVISILYFTENPHLPGLGKYYNLTGVVDNFISSSHLVIEENEIKIENIYSIKAL